MSGALGRFRDWWTRCGGHCFMDYDAADAYTESLMRYGTTEGALERASRCYHKNRPRYSDE